MFLMQLTALYVLHSEMYMDIGEWLSFITEIQIYYSNKDYAGEKSRTLKSTSCKSSLGFILYLY